MQITVTESAARQLIDSGLDEEKFLRLGVKPGGCAGMSYDAYIDDTVTENDEIVYDSHPLRVVAHVRFLPLLEGLTIDFSDDLVRPGFILKNPNVQQSCGCGSSFKADGAASCAGGCGS
ncbi:MAG: HesB/IscA family protein [Kiritimatiellales bacterium]